MTHPDSPQPLTLVIHLTWDLFSCSERNRMFISHLSGLLIWGPKNQCGRQSPSQSLRSYLTMCVASHSPGDQTIQWLLLSFFLESFLFFSFHHLYDIVASCLCSCSIPPLPFLPFLIPHRCSGGRVYWNKERLVPGGPGEWSCSRNKAAFRFNFTTFLRNFLRMSEFFAWILSSWSSLYFQCNQLAALPLPAGPWLARLSLQDSKWSNTLVDLLTV